MIHAGYLVPIIFVTAIAFYGVGFFKGYYYCAKDAVKAGVANWYMSVTSRRYLVRYDHTDSGQLPNKSIQIF